MPGSRKLWRALHHCEDFLPAAAQVAHTTNQQGKFDQRSRTVEDKQVSEIPVLSSLMPLSVSEASPCKRMSSFTGSPKPLPTSRPGSKA